MERVYKTVKDGSEKWSIVVKGKEYYFRGKLNGRCSCFYTGCEKLRFPYREVAHLFAEYQFIKYDRQNTVYWSEDCECYHLRTSRHDDGIWVRRR